MTDWLPARDFLAGEKALVTGAGSGIGRAIALALAAHGAAVALASRGEASLRETAALVEAQGGVAQVLTTDLSSASEATALPGRAADTMGGLTIVVNNAGAGIYGPLEHASTEDFAATFDTNVRAPWLVARGALPHFRAAGRGAIAMIASVVAHKGYVNQGLYSASKHALLGLSRVMAQELAPDNVRVLVVSPGGVDTPMARAARPDLDPAILISAEEVARALLFQLSLKEGGAVDEVRMRRASGAPWL